MSDYPPLSSLHITEVLEEIPDMAFVYRDDGLLMAMNSACERLTGVPRAAVVGSFKLQDSAMMIGAELMAGYQGAMAGTPQTVPPTEIRITHDRREQTPFNRAVFWVETTIFPISRRADGTGHYVMGIQRDITELMTARAAIEVARKQIEFQQDTIDSLESARREIESQRATIEALSTPVIEVWDGVVTLPLLGRYNTDRAAQMTAQVLEAVTRTRARYVILDLTGVAVFDATTGDNLLQIVAAVGLLGATGILVGIQPGVAQLLVGLGAGLQHVRVYQDLRQALKMCMREMASRTSPTDALARER